MLSARVVLLPHFSCPQACVPRMLSRLLAAPLVLVCQESLQRRCCSVDTLFVCALRVLEASFLRAAVSSRVLREASFYVYRLIYTAFSSSDVLTVILGCVNAGVVAVNARSLRIPGVDALVTLVLLSPSLPIVGVVVLLQLLADLEGAWRAWMIAPAALLAALVAMWSLWAGFVVYYLVSVVLGYYTGLLGGKFWSFVLLNGLLNGALLMFLS